VLIRGLVAAAIAAAEAAGATFAAAEAATRAAAAEAAARAAAAEAAAISTAEAAGAGTVATEAAGAGTVTTEGRTFFARASDIDLQGATHEVDVLGLSDRILSGLSIGHGHEGEATRTTRELVHHDFHGDHFAALGEVSADVGFGCGPGQVAHEQFVFHIIFCFAWFTYTALPVSDLRISICRLNDRQLTGLLRGLSLTLVIFRDKPDRC
jgi:nucleoid-associated protein YgaU